MPCSYENESNSSIKLDVGVYKKRECVFESWKRVRSEVNHLHLQRYLGRLGERYIMRR